MGPKEIKKPMIGIVINKPESSKSSLHTKVQNLVSRWFGTTGKYITMTLKCPLGQLSKEQIDKGRIVLDDCKDRINGKLKITESEYDKLTSNFYSLIPHVLPSKIDAMSLRLNSIDRVMAKHEMLDTFLDAKNVEGVIGVDNVVDEQYKKLNANLDWVDPNDPISKWINSLVQGTRASNHRFLGDIKVLNIFSLSRNIENEQFIDRAKSISKERKTKEYIWPNQLRKFGEERLDIKEEKNIYKEANIVPLFHGTRTENMVGIVTRGLLIRPSGAVYTGSAFGSGCYFGYSSKALNYSSCYGTYWAKGNDKSGFLFLADVCLGDPKSVSNSGFYTADNIRPYHSVWAKSGGYLINDEFILYHPTGRNQQHNLRYILEISTQN